jgi:hypothetical protein
MQYADLRTHTIVASSYAPLLLIFIVKDIKVDGSGLTLGNPVRSFMLLAIAILRCMTVLSAAASMNGGLPVKVTKASNKSGDMFGYTIPYMISFIKFDPDWADQVLP